MTVSEAMDAYLSQKRMEGVAEATVEFYQGRFARFRRFAGDRLITDIKAADIIAYAGTLPESWSPTTTKHNTAVCKAAGVAVARDALGHTNISTTSRYVHPDLKDVQKASEDVYGDQSPHVPAPDHPKPQKPRISVRATVSGGAADGRRLDQDAGSANAVSAAGEDGSHAAP